MKPWVNDIQAHIQTWSDRLGNLSWWPRYVYHFTDVQNAVNILQNGHLYSRTEANKRGLMTIDNASPQIIQQTKAEHLDYVRLYFRPRTPTQYRNEGIRPLNQRELGGAHCPIPVFFCFDALTILGLDETEFSNGNMGTTQAIHSSERDFFLSIPFNHVFHNSWFSPQERNKIVFHRNAEVLVPNKLALDSALKFIACRSIAERQTLLHLLPIGLANRWSPRIRLGISDLFFRKWTFVEEVLIIDKKVTFRFNPDSEIPGPFSLHFTYQEDGSDIKHPKTIKKEKLLPSLTIDFGRVGHRWGSITLHLDDALAFAGLAVFEEIPF